MSSRILAEMFLLHFTLSGCVIPFRELHHDHGWHVPAISDYQKVRFCIHEQHNRGWHVAVTFYSQWVRIPISWAGSSWLTCSCHLWLSGSAYMYFMSSTIMADVSLPLLTLSGCVFPFRELDWTIVAYMFLPFWLSGSAYLYFNNSTITAYMFLLLFLTLRACVFPFRERDYHGLHVPDIFDY